eukprot:9485995-Pyramimonas_sp.AAC.1
MNADAAPAWLAAFVTGQFATLTSNVGDFNKILTSQVIQIDGRMAALEIKAQELQAKQQES